MTLLIVRIVRAAEAACPSCGRPRRRLRRSASRHGHVVRANAEPTDTGRGCPRKATGPPRSLQCRQTITQTSERWRTNDVGHRLSTSTLVEGAGPRRASLVRAGRDLRRRRKNANGACGWPNELLLSNGDPVRDRGRNCAPLLPVLLTALAIHGASFCCCGRCRGDLARRTIFVWKNQSAGNLTGSANRHRHPHPLLPSSASVVVHRRDHRHEPRCCYRGRPDPGSSVRDRLPARGDTGVANRRERFTRRVRRATEGPDNRPDRPPRRRQQIRPVQSGTPTMRALPSIDDSPPGIPRTRRKCPLRQLGRARRQVPPPS